jgi:hypothetical protein
LRQQLIRSQLERADRLGQLQRIQPLAQQCAELLCIGTRRCQDEPATGRGDTSVHQPALELCHATLMRGEKNPERSE